MILKMSKCPVLGYLEGMWHFSGKYTPHGDIGKYSNEEIEAWLEWDGEPGALIEAFRLAGWIDASESHRFVVHDWHLHADNATKLSVKRSGRDFVTKQATVSPHCAHTVEESTTPLRLPEPEPVPEPEPEPEPVPGNAVSSIDHSQVAAGVISQLCISGQDLVRNISDVCKAEMKLGKSPEWLLATMVGNYRDFLSEKSAGHLSFAPGAAKFFGENLWKDKNIWPWKEGFAPPPPKPKRIYINSTGGDAA
jgi:hypothetical protein